MFLDNMTWMHILFETFIRWLESNESGYVLENRLCFFFLLCAYFMFLDFVVLPISNFHILFFSSLAIGPLYITRGGIFSTFKLYDFACVTYCNSRNLLRPRWRSCAQSNLKSYFYHVERVSLFLMYREKFINVRSSWSSHCSFLQILLIHHCFRFVQCMFEIHVCCVC